MGKEKTAYLFDPEEMGKMESDPWLVLHFRYPKALMITAGDIHYYLQSKKEVSHEILLIFI